MAKIIIVGGSLGGLFAANLLRKNGHDVIILEKAIGSLDGRGAGIVTHDALMDTLETIGIGIDANIGVRVTSRVSLNEYGDTISEIPLEQTLTSWSRLYHLLKANFPDDRYLQGKSVVKINQTDTTVTIYCEDQSTYEADLVIASDGLRSAVRANLVPDIKPEYAGYVAWRGVCDENLLSKKTLNTLFNHFGFCLPQGEQILGYPVAGSGNNIHAGQRRYNFVWYRPASEDQELKNLLTDADGMYYPDGIPPLKVSWEHISNVRQTARKILAPQFAEILEKTALVFFQPIYDLRSDRVSFGRIALMGDASFVGRPHVGMGVTKAADDAMSIAQNITQYGANPSALIAYENERLEVGQLVIKRAQYLGKYMQSQNKSSNLADVQRSALTVMAETAVDITNLLQSKQVVPNN